MLVERLADPVANPLNVLSLTAPLSCFLLSMHAPARKYTNFPPLGSGYRGTQSISGLAAIGGRTLAPPGPRWDAASSLRLLPLGQHWEGVSFAVAFAAEGRSIYFSVYFKGEGLRDSREY